MIVAEAPVLKIGALGRPLLREEQPACEKASGARPASVAASARRERMGTPRTWRAEAPDPTGCKNRAPRGPLRDPSVPAPAYRLRLRARCQRAAEPREGNWLPIPGPAVPFARRGQLLACPADVRPLLPRDSGPGAGPRIRARRGARARSALQRRAGPAGAAGAGRARRARAGRAALGLRTGLGRGFRARPASDQRACRDRRRLAVLPGRARPAARAGAGRRLLRVAARRAQRAAVRGAARGPRAARHERPLRAL